MEGYYVIRDYKHDTKNAQLGDVLIFGAGKLIVMHIHPNRLAMLFGWYQDEPVVCHIQLAK